MELIILLLLAGGMLFGLARGHAGFLGWAAAVAGVLILLMAGAWSGWLGWGYVIALAIPLLAWMLMFALAPLRRRFISAPALAHIASVLPPISDTEREAIEAGTVGWEGELFKGDPDWKKFLAMPPPVLSEEEREFLVGPVETLCGLLDDWQIREMRQLPASVWELLKRERFFGLIIPKRYGGREFSTLAHSAVVIKIASRSASAGVTVMVPNSLGPAELLLHYGTQSQRDHFLPRLARGEEIPCFALTSPVAGSDAGAIPDTGIIGHGTHEGREVLGLRLNWDKRYITLAPLATLLGLAFKVLDPDRLLGGSEELGITCALIPVSTPGVEIGARHYPSDMGFPNGPTRGREVFIPLSFVIGGREGIGHGWRMLMESLSVGRGISLPALAAAQAKLACRTSGAYARVRRQFRLPIGRFEGVEEALARLGGLSFLIDSGRLLVAGAIDAGEKPAVATALLKYLGTDLVRQGVQLAMDVHGGRAVCDGPANYLLGPYGALPMLVTVEGANILTRSLIVFGQGALRCHPYLLEEIRAAGTHDATALRRFDRAFSAHLGHVLRNAARAFLYGLSAARLAPTTVRGAHAAYFRKLGRWSAAFALLADVTLLRLGGTLKRREKISGRFADALGHLFLASAALKRYEDLGRPAALWPIVEWGMQYCLWQIQNALDGILRNFPSPLAAFFVRGLLMPLGCPERFPSDTLGARVAAILMEPGPAREVLTEGIYAGSGPADLVGRLEDALLKVVRAEPVESRLRGLRLAQPAHQDFGVWVADLLTKAILNEDEATRLLESQQAMLRAIQVDEFPAATKPLHAAAADGEIA